MTRTIQSILASVAAILVLALSPSFASALTIDPIGNNGYTNAQILVITYGDPGGLTGPNCILDSAGPVTCSSSSVQLDGLTEGLHSLTVNGVVLVNGSCIAWNPSDPTQCVGWNQIGQPVSASTSFTVDRTAPAVSITGGPTEGSSSAATSASFGIAASDGSVSCTLDGAPIPCGNTAELQALSVGPHQLVVNAVDQAGNVGSAARNFTVVAPPAALPTPQTPAAAAILSLPSSAKLGSKIKLKVSCVEGCSIAVAVRVGSRVAFRKTLTVAPGATTATFTPGRKLTRKLSTALKERRKVIAEFSVKGAVARTTRIKR